MSALIAPLAISSFSSPMDLPVVREISSSGLKPALIIWLRSWPVSLPVEDIWANANVSDSIFCASPWEISPSWPSLRVASSALIPNAMRVWVFFAKSSMPNGVFAAWVFRSLTSCWAFA